MPISLLILTSKRLHNSRLGQVRTRRVCLRHLHTVPHLPLNQQPLLPQLRLNQRSPQPQLRRNRPPLQLL